MIDKTEIKNTTGLVWFGNDLRIHDNDVLSLAVKKHSKVTIPFELNHLEEKSILFKNEQTGKESLLKLWPDHIISDRVLGELRRPVQNANSFSINYSMPCIVFVDRNRRKVDLSIFRWGQKQSLNLDT